MKTRLSHIAIFIIVLMSVSLACGAGSKSTESPADQPAAATQPPADVVAPTVPPKEQVQLGEVQREEDGGYTYQPVPGYQVNAGLGMVSMLAEGADPDIGPSISLFGGPPDPGMTNQTMIDQLKGSQDTQLGDITPVKIGGYDGLAADITINRNERELYGRIAVVVTPENQFAILAGGPQESWEDELEPFFEAVLSSITFFTPSPLLQPSEAPTEAPTETAEAIAENQGTVVHQWAISATASSQYTDSGWNASQATGEPNVAECADDSKAWASDDFDTVEWLEVSYNTPVIPIQVNIYETYNAGQIVKVELLDVYNDYHEIYTAQVQTKDCPSVLTIEVPSASYQALAVRITVDQTQLLSWAEIDAVELVGYSDSSATFDPANLDVVYDSASGLPMLSDAQVVSSSAENLLYTTGADLATLQDFYLANLPLTGWLLDLDENGKCRDDDRCMGWHGGYTDASTTYFFLSGEHAYLTLNFVPEGDRYQVIALIDPDYE
jgi:hypothetical protein